MGSRSADGSEFLSDKLLDAGAHIAPNAPFNYKEGRLLFEALAYLVAAEEERQAQTRRFREGE